MGNIGVIKGDTRSLDYSSCGFRIEIEHKTLNAPCVEEQSGAVGVCVPSTEPVNQ